MANTRDMNGTKSIRISADKHEALSKFHKETGIDIRVLADAAAGRFVDAVESHGLFAVLGNSTNEDQPRSRRPGRA